MYYCQHLVWSRFHMLFADNHCVFLQVLCPLCVSEKKKTTCKPAWDLSKACIPWLHSFHWNPLESVVMVACHGGACGQRCDPGKLWWYWLTLYPKQVHFHLERWTPNLLSWNFMTRPLRINLLSTADFGPFHKFWDLGGNQLTVGESGSGSIQFNWPTVQWLWMSVRQKLEMFWLGFWSINLKPGLAKSARWSMPLETISFLIAPLLHSLIWGFLKWGYPNG